MSTTKKWTYIAIPTILIEKVDRIIENRKTTYPNKPQFIAAAIRRFLEEIGKERP